MAPGILRIVPPEGSEVLPREGNLVAVRAEGNPAACAVGRLRLPAAAVGAGTKGEAVEVLHYFGDALWEAMGSPRPDGFVGAEIQPTEATEVQASAPAEAQGYPPTTEVDAAKDSEESGAKAGPDMDKALEETLLQAIKTRIKDRDLPMAGNVVYTQHMRPCRRAGSNIDVKVSSFKKLGAFLAHAEDLQGSKSRDAQGKPRAALTMRHKACKKCVITITITRPSMATIFIVGMQELGWIAMKKSSDPVMTRIFRDHPDIREWKPWPKHVVTAEADEAPAEAAGKDANCPSAAIQIELVWKIVKLKPILEVLKAEMPSDECWTREEFPSSEVVCRRSLKNNRKRIGPDPLLHSALQTPSEESAASMSPDAVTDNILRTLPLCHRVTAPQGGAAGGLKTSVRPGKPPSVQVRTDTRRGHNVTLIQGLEAYGVNMEAFASSLQKALASAAVVEEASPTQAACVMVQGFWDVAVMDWLVKVGIPSECILHQAKKGQQQKKAKQASNIGTSSEADAASTQDRRLWPHVVPYRLGMLRFSDFGLLQALRCQKATAGTRLGPRKLPSVAQGPDLQVSRAARTPGNQPTEQPGATST
ncbi:Eif2d [Symbiodinium necroappetens]|uniref:Eif2d protein n=1 Tax=Symbiodinium necroappetens TaxID=1628268 RepID=A0A813CLK6_9DINO|nr:Eif2d [Symbiodinium necroappetens]